MNDFPDLDELCARAPRKLGRQLTDAERDLLAIARELLLEPHDLERRPAEPAHHSRPWLAYASGTKRPR